MSTEPEPQPTTDDPNQSQTPTPTEEAPAPTPEPPPPAPTLPSTPLTFEPATWYEVTSVCVTETCPNLNTTTVDPLVYSNAGTIIMICGLCGQQRPILAATKLDPQPEMG